MLDNQHQIDIIIGYATKQRERQYQSVALPISRGLDGCRIPLVRAKNSDLFNKIDNFEDFRKFVPGLVYSWQDRIIMEANSLTIATTTADKSTLFNMLIKNRADYLPRSILEVDNEISLLRDQHQLDIVIEPNLIIFYPTALFFYVRKDNHELAKLLNVGFETILKNGKFEQIFNQHFATTLRHLKQQRRTVIHLSNPLLPKSVPLDRKELWIDPSQHKLNKGSRD